MTKRRFLLALMFALFVFTNSGFADSMPALFDFNTVPLSTPVPFSLTNNGITATFSSPDGAGVFTVGSGFFLSPPILGNVLLQGDPAARALDIKFSEAMRLLSLDFALNSFVPESLIVTASLGGSTVGNLSYLATFPPGSFFPQGTVTFGGFGLFDSVRLTSTAQDFAIDNVAVALPASSTVLLMGLGLSMIALVRRHTNV